ncbi:hypothetical protein BS17DRAFT_750562 [Gyrodon lividus]|nr:hypothetical protein BS17DRAFT_750562 [Gyrodon lividus]
MWILNFKLKNYTTKPSRLSRWSRWNVCCYVLGSSEACGQSSNGRIGSMCRRLCLTLTRHDIDKHVVFDTGRSNVGRLQFPRYVHESLFGEDALDLSIKKTDTGTIVGHVRIRSKTQGIALSLGDRITMSQNDLRACRCKAFSTREGREPS